MTPNRLNNSVVPHDRQTAVEPDCAEQRQVPQAFDERRKYWRSSVLWPARVVAPTISLPCIVLNVSRGGARLRFQEPVAMPKSFTLAMDHFGEFPVERMGNEDARASVRFVDEPEKIGRIFGRSVPAILADAPRH